MAAAQLDILFCQRLHKSLRLFSSPYQNHGAVPRVHLLVQRDLTLPLGVKQVLPALGCLILGHQLRVIADNVVSIEVVYPKTLGILESRRVDSTLGRDIELEKARLDQLLSFDSSNGYEIEENFAGTGLIQNAFYNSRGAGGAELGVDGRMGRVDGVEE